MDTEQTPVMENSEQISAPEPTPSPVVNKGKPFKSGYVVAMLLFLVIALMCGLTYFVLKDKGIDLLSSQTKTNTTKDTTTDTDTSTTEEETTDTTVCENADTNCDLSVDNKGWGLFSVPEYGFSVEIPSYDLEQQLGLEKEKVTSYWRVTNRATTGSGYGGLQNPLTKVNVLFYPQFIPASVACGQGCVNENDIDIYIYENKGQKNLTTLSNEYKANWSADDLEFVSSLTGSITKKWGIDVWAFEFALPENSRNGYLLTSGNLIYEVVYFISDSPVESAQVAQQVIDSMKFGQ